MPQDSAGSKALSREPSMEIEYDESADEIFDPDDSQASSHETNITTFLELSLCIYIRFLGIYRIYNILCVQIYIRKEICVEREIYIYIMCVFFGAQIYWVKKTTYKFWPGSWRHTSSDNLAFSSAIQLQFWNFWHLQGAAAYWWDIGHLSSCNILRLVLKSIYIYII